MKARDCARRLTLRRLRDLQSLSSILAADAFSHALADCPSNGTG